MRKILRISWPRVISNEELKMRTSVEDVGNTIRERRLKYVGHKIRSEDKISKIAIKWTPEGRRSKGRPASKWRRTMEDDLQRAGWSMGQK